MVIVCCGILWFQCERVNMDFVKDATAIFVYKNNNIVHQLNDDEVSTIKNIFNGKKMYSDNPSCGFDETISVKFNNTQTFCIARDTCPIVYWKEKNTYIKLSESEKNILYDLLSQYGFFFPCL